MRVHCWVIGPVAPSFEACCQVTSTPSATESSLCGGGAEFVSRHSVDGRFTFADQRAAQVVGYAPADLLGKLCYEFYHPEDQQHMRDNFDQGEKAPERSTCCSSSVEQHLY